MSTLPILGLGGLVLAGALLTACANSSSDTPAAAVDTPVSTTRSYSGTASVGDFLTVRLDTVAHTMHYKNTTNGDEYDVSYTLDTDGAYLFNDLSGNLATAYEVPGFAMVIKANKTGPGKDTISVITAIQSTTVTTDVFKNKDYNYMQFRTSSGGMELGHVHCGADGTINPNGFWPYGGRPGSTDTAFHNGTLPLTGITALPDNSALRLDSVEGGITSSDYIFATTGGFLAVDTPNGAIVCMQQRSSSAFDAPTMAGTYKAILFSKNDATTGAGNVETGLGGVAKGTMVIDNAGLVSVSDGAGTPILTDAPLTALKDTPLRGTGKLEDDCNGLFRFKTGDSNHPREVYLAFMTDAVLIASFKFNVFTQHYDYFYGVGLRSGTAAIGQTVSPKLVNQLAVMTAGRH